MNSARKGCGWVHVDGRSFWSSNADAPLPRREITKRQDYNVTLRRNHHEIFDWGWSHEQDNDKLVREADKKDVILAQEKGYNTYRKVENDIVEIVRILHQRMDIKKRLK